MFMTEIYTQLNKKSGRVIESRYIKLTVAGGIRIGMTLAKNTYKNTILAPFVFWYSARCFISRYHSVEPGMRHFVSPNQWRHVSQKARIVLRDLALRHINIYSMAILEQAHTQKYRHTVLEKYKWKNSVLGSRLGN